MFYNVIIKGYSVGMTKDLAEARAWASGNSARDVVIRPVVSSKGY